MTLSTTVGVLALQGAFFEHTKLLKQAATQLQAENEARWVFIEVRTVEQLERCDALIIPGGESTTVSLVAARSNLLEPLRDFVKYAFAKPGSGAVLTCRVQSAPETNMGDLCWINLACGVCQPD